MTEPIHPDVKSALDALMPNLQFDKDLAVRLQRYKQEFINRNRDHAAFFGGNLLGVQTVRFVPQDVNNWFDNILDADEEAIREAIHKSPGINKDWHVSSNPMNVTCLWLVHRIFRSSMPAELKTQAMTDTLLILQIKMVTSIMFNFFKKYPASPEVAEATYAALNMKFILKEQGSWLALLTYRAESILSRNSPLYDAISSFTPNKRIIEALNSIHGALKGYIRKIRQVMGTVLVSGGKISATSAAVNANGEEILRDKTRGPMTYTNYLKSIISDKNSFIREELFHIVTKVMPSAQPRYLRASLEFISANYFRAPHKDIERMINLAMLHSHAYLAQSRLTMRSNVDLGEIMIELKGAYTSSRSRDSDLLELREITERVIRGSVDSKTESVVASVRTGVLLYIVSRAYAMNHYSGRV